MAQKSSKHKMSHILYSNNDSQSDLNSILYTITPTSMRWILTFDRKNVFEALSTYAFVCESGVKLTNEQSGHY